MQPLSQFDQHDVNISAVNTVFDGFLLSISMNFNMHCLQAVSLTP